MQADDVLLEILVGDDLSQDNTGEIVQKIASQYPGLIRYFRHSENKGYAGNFQFLLQEAQGEYIAHLDGDDYWLPEKLSAQVQVLDRHSEYSAVYTNALVVDESGMTRGLFNNRLSKRFNMSELLRYGNFLNNSSMLYRITQRSSILSINEPFIDFRVHLRHALHNDIAYINQVLVVYRVTSSSSMLVYQNDKVRKMYWEAIQDVPKDTVNKIDLGRCMAEFMRSVIFRSIRLGSFSLIKKWWPQVFNEAPLPKTVMLFWLVYAIFRTIYVETIGRACAIIGGSRVRVYYRR